MHAEGHIVRHGLDGLAQTGEHGQVGFHAAVRFCQDGSGSKSNSTVPESLRVPCGWTSPDIRANLAAGRGNPVAWETLSDRFIAGCGDCPSWCVCAIVAEG